MKTLITLVTVFSLSLWSATSFCSNGVLEKYKYRYASFEEADVDTVIKLLYHSDAEVRNEAATLVDVAFSKGFVSARKALPRLIEILESDSNSTVQVSAAIALGRSGQRRVVGHLIEAAKVNDSSQPVLIAAIMDYFPKEAATKKELHEVANIAVQNMNTTHYWLRFRSVEWVGEYRDRDERMKRLFLQSFIDHYEHPVPSFKDSIIPGTSGRTQWETLSEWYEVYLLSFEPDLLIPLLGHSNLQIRLKVALTLARLHDKRSIGPLIEILRNGSDYDHGSRCHAARALPRDKRSISALKDVMNDQFAIEGKDGKPYRVVADCAYEALMRMGIVVDEPQDIRDSRPLRHRL
ncbi:HEAT repeat domain-containing protein [candidate division TA06 bacterium]|uniref:HEAT repeat domain-containing protein n=1 Tax=candidate division TA06 bacterium TaxID=2250710 RepID=A0A523UVU2_UNCT6|nr:MAG: HEAT repeat domain-containing protein [candidate division TA06 bacterium]